MPDQKTITFEIERQDPDNGNESYWDSFEVECEPMDRVLDALMTIRGDKDGTLAYRKSCAHGVCGSDAMNINGQNRLACQTLLDDLGFPNKVTIRPLPAMDTVKDLVVDMESFEQKTKQVEPYQITDQKMPNKERKQSQEEQKLIEESTTCIQCGACTSSCPSSWNNPDYIGPAAMLKAYRYTFDTRDDGADERLDALDVDDGLWRCHTIFNCVEACPKDINLTWHISELKKAVADREV
jgi:succinate dehydrogenase / fumarate reductase iron-sulfur subunit